MPGPGAEGTPLTISAIGTLDVPSSIRVPIRRRETPVFTSTEITVVSDPGANPDVPKVDGQLEGIELRAVGGKEAVRRRFGVRRTRALKAAGDRYAIAKVGFETAEYTLAATAEPVFRLVHQTGNVVRGLNSQEGNYGILVYPSETNKYDPVKLRERLQESYDDVAQESARITIPLPDIHNTPEGRRKLRRLVRSIRRVLRGTGSYSKEYVDRSVDVALLVRIQQEQINDMLNSGQIESLEGARKSDTEWKIHFRALDKKRPVLPRKRRRSPTVPKT